MNENRDLVIVMIVTAIGVLTAAVAAVRNATRSGPREVTSTRSQIHQRSPGVPVMVASIAGLLGAGIAVLFSMPERAPVQGVPASETGRVVAETPAARDEGPWLAIAVAAGAVTVALGGIVFFRARNTRS